MVTDGRRLALFRGWVGLLLLLSGCQEQTSVQGTVTYNGQPLTRGILSVVPVGAGPGEGAKIQDGAYQIDSLQPGKMKFGVRGELGGERDTGPVTSENKHATIATADRAQFQQIPADAEGNGRIHEIVPGPQTIDIKLIGP